MKDYVAIARQYEADVVSGAAPACKWVRLAVERNQRDQLNAGTDAFPYRFDDVAASKICRFAEMLPHVKGPKAKRTGETFDGNDGRKYPVWSTIVLEPWQCWILTTSFGWLRLRDGLRRFRILFPIIARKNAKSTLAAIVALFMLVADGEVGAECYAAATTREQAKVVAEISWEMARRSRAFCEFYGVRVGSATTKTLSVPGTASKFLPLSADANSLDGLNISFAAVDEFHAHKTRAVWDVLETATGARPQPILMPITTAGVDLGGICHAQVQYLKQVLEGVFTDERFFGVYYTIDDGDDYRDPIAHRKANPNAGVSVDVEDLERKAEAASHSPDAINNFLTKHLNVWVRQEASYIPIRELIALGDLTLRIEDFKDAPCWIGVDLAEIKDVAAVAALFRPDPQRYVAFVKLFLPSRAVQQSPVAQMPGWVRGKHIIETDGNQADYARIQGQIVEWCETFSDVREIDFDRALAAQMEQDLKRHFTPAMGKDAVEKFVITVKQNTETMNPALQMVNGLILAGHFQHEANPALVWMFSNIVVERNHKDEVYPRKLGGKDSPNKIDGPMAIYTAFSRASQADIRPKRKRSSGALVWTPGGFVPALPEGAPSDTPAAR